MATFASLCSSPFKYCLKYTYKGEVIDLGCGGNVSVTLPKPTDANPIVITATVDPANSNATFYGAATYPANASTTDGKWSGQKCDWTPGASSSITLNSNSTWFNGMNINVPYNGTYNYVPPTPPMIVPPTTITISGYSGAIDTPIPALGGHDSGAMGALSGGVPTLTMSRSSPYSVCSGTMFYQGTAPAGPQVTVGKGTYTHTDGKQYPILGGKATISRNGKAWCTASRNSPPNVPADCFNGRNYNSEWAAGGSYNQIWDVIETWVPDKPDAGVTAYVVFSPGDGNEIWASDYRNKGDDFTLSGSTNGGLSGFYTPVNIPGASNMATGNQGGSPWTAS